MEIYNFKFDKFGKWYFHSNTLKKQLNRNILKQFVLISTAINRFQNTPL